MTDKPSDYVYSLNKKIKIRGIEFKDGLGTLTVTHASVLKEEPFEIPMFDGYREDGTAIDSRNKKTNDNFTVKDSQGESAKRNPEVEDELVEAKQNSFIVALKIKKILYNKDGIT